ncbi:hypothetical protein SB776_33410, partial [Burkholderia sp. SIMBA_045]
RSHFSAFSEVLLPVLFPPDKYLLENLQIDLSALWQLLFLLVLWMLFLQLPLFLGAAFFVVDLVSIII